MNSWRDIFRKRADDWVFARLEPGQVPSTNGGQEIVADAAYISVYLRSARVLDVRKGLRNFYGVVHSKIRLPHRSGSQAEFNVVAVPTSLREVDSKRLDRVIQLDQRLLGPVPYVGGDITMEVGLFSVATADLAGPYLELLEMLSSAAGVASVAAALRFASPITHGINLLTAAADDSMLEIGVSRSESHPKSGWYVVIRASKSEFDVNSLRVDPQDGRLLDADGKPLKEFPYMVLETTAEPARDDWFQIPEISESYKSIQFEYRRGRQEQTEEAITAFCRTVLTCNDLLFCDAERLITKVKDLYLKQGPPQAGVRSVGRTPFPDFESLDLYASSEANRRH
jgi:hypothetical protein